MKKVYIAGKFRAKNRWEQVQNIRRAEEAGMSVAELGCIPVIPHTLYGEWDGTLTDQFWLDATMELMLLCDSVFVIENWRTSTGTIGEIERAEIEEMPVFYKENQGLEKLAIWAEHTSPPQQLELPL